MARIAPRKWFDTEWKKILENLWVFRFCEGIFMISIRVSSGDQSRDQTLNWELVGKYHIFIHFEDISRKNYFRSEKDCFQGSSNDFLTWDLFWIKAKFSLFSNTNSSTVCLIFKTLDWNLIICVTYHDEVGKVWSSCCKVISKSHQATKWQGLS